jgi:hypothetical protein
MDVVIEELVGLGLEAGGDGEIERVRWRWPGHPTRRRLGGGLRFLNLGWALACDQRRSEQREHDHSAHTQRIHAGSMHRRLAVRRRLSARRSRGA